MEKQSPTCDFLVLFLFFFVSSITFVFFYILKKVKRRAKYNAILPGMKIAWHDVMACARYINLSKKSRDVSSFQLSALKSFAGHAKLYQQEKLLCHWIVYHPFVIPLKGETIEKMLRDAAMQDKDFMYKQFFPILGEGLVTSSGDTWKGRRRLLNPCFHSEVLKDYVPIFDAQACKLVKNLQKGGDDEIKLLYKPIFQCVLDIVLETNFGLNIEAENIETKNLFDVFESIKTIFMERALNWWMWSDFIFRFTKSCRIYNYNKSIAEDFTNSILQRKKNQYVSRTPEGKTKKRNSIMEMLLEYHMETGSISEEAILEELNTFIAAATDTTSIALIYALYSIGQHKDIQANVHREVDRIFGDNNDRPVEKEDLNGMKYIECVLKETLRLYPPVPFISRMVSKETNICGYSIPEGASCSICPYILHRDPETFPNPEKFDPTRFLPENSEKRHPLAYIPFSAGPRNCIGQKFAMMAMKTVLCNILRNFSVESLDQRDKLNLGMDVTLTPSIPLRFRLKSRI